MINSSIFSTWKVNSKKLASDISKEKHGNDQIDKAAFNAKSTSKATLGSKRHTSKQAM